MNRKKICLIMLVVFWALIFNFNLINSSETKNIEYEIRVTYTPECKAEVCVNTTVNETVCKTDCFGKFKVEGLNNNNFFMEIDIGDGNWKNGNSESRFGYKLTELGNLSDISGIRSDLHGCLDNYDNLLTCENSNRNIDLNLTNCITQTGYGTNYSLDDCEIKANNIQNELNTKSSEIGTKNQELESMKNIKWTWGVLGAILGFLFCKVGLPYFKGRNSPTHEEESAFASNTGY